MQGLEDLDLLVPHRLRREVDRRLHGRERDELEHVVLDDVPDRTRLLVEARPPLDAERLGHGDLHVVDELPVPDRLEDAVREPQDQHVLDGLLAQVVVDAEDLLLVEVGAEERVQLLRAREVVAERLLDDEARPAACGTAAAHRRHDVVEGLGRDGEVVDAVPGGPVRLVEVGESGDELVLAALDAEVRRHVVEPVGEALPDVRAELVARVLDHRLAHALTELVGRHLRAGDADDAEAARGAGGGTRARRAPA